MGSGRIQTAQVGSVAGGKRGSREGSQCAAGLVDGVGANRVISLVDSIEISARVIDDEALRIIQIQGER